MDRIERCRRVRQGHVEKYGRVPPKSPVVIVKRVSPGEAKPQPKSSGNGGTGKACKG